MHHWILASCDLGGLGELAGPELEGVLAALLEGGAGAVLAAVASIPDAATASLMVPLHAALAAGHSLPAALCHARLRWTPPTLSRSPSPRRSPATAAVEPARRVRRASRPLPTPDRGRTGAAARSHGTDGQATRISHL